MVVKATTIDVDTCRKRGRRRILEQPQPTAICKQQTISDIKKIDSPILYHIFSPKVGASDVIAALESPEQEQEISNYDEIIMRFS